MPVLLPHLRPGRRLVHRALTFSGNEITDASRALALAGDGLAGDGSTGIYKAVTNLRLNGGFETNATGWSGLLSATATRVTTQHKFGSAALEVTTPGAAQGEGTEATAITVTASNPYSEGIWVKAPIGATLRLQLAERLAADLVDITTTNTDFVGTGDWQSIAVAKALGATSVREHVRVITRASNQAITFWVDGSQLETTLVRTPFIPTDGSTATRPAGRVQLPIAGLVTVAQGWVAMKLRYTLPADEGSVVADWFSWVTDTPNRILAFMNGSITFPVFRRGATGDLTLGPLTINAPAILTFIFAWTPTVLAMSFNGGVFSTAANTNTALTISQPLLDIGSQATQSAGREANLDYFWMAFGAGTLTDQDAAYLASFGPHTPPDPRALPGDCRGVWNGASPAFRRVASVRGA